MRRSLVLLLVIGCPAAPEPPAEGEGDVVSGEGEFAGEGEGDVVGEGEFAGEGEGDVVGEGGVRCGRTWQCGVGCSATAAPTVATSPAGCWSP